MDHGAGNFWFCALFILGGLQNYLRILTEKIKTQLPGTEENRISI